MSGTWLIDNSFDLDHHNELSFADNILYICLILDANIFRHCIGLTVHSWVRQSVVNTATAVRQIGRVMVWCVV